MNCRFLAAGVAVLVGVSGATGCGDAPDPKRAPEVRRASETTEITQPTQAVQIPEDAIVGVKIYQTDRDPQELFDEWRALGINTVFASEELTSSRGFRALARKNTLDLFVIFPVFFAPEEISEEPGLSAITVDGTRARDDWVEFACPSRTDFRDRRIEEARDIVKRLRPDGLSLDFIRHFIFWEMIGPDDDPTASPEACYCVHCLQGFATFLGIPQSAIPPEPQRAARWIRANAAGRWARFRIETITTAAAEIAEAVRLLDEDVLIAVHSVPWRRDDYDGALTRVTGQDLSALGEMADYISPMAYSFMLYRPPEWVASVVEDQSYVAGCPVVPSIQVAPAYREGEAFSPLEFEAALRSALEPPSAGVVFWSWDHLEADPERAAIIRRVIGRASSDPVSAGPSGATTVSRNAGTATTSTQPTPAR